MRILRFFISGLIFLFLLQIRVGEKTLERHLMGLPPAQFLANGVDNLAHQLAKLAQLSYRHTIQIYHEMKKNEHPSHRAGK